MRAVEDGLVDLDRACHSQQSRQVSRRVLPAIVTRMVDEQSAIPVRAPAHEPNPRRDGGDVQHPHVKLRRHHPPAAPAAAQTALHDGDPFVRVRVPGRRDRIARIGIDARRRHKNHRSALRVQNARDACRGPLPSGSGVVRVERVAIKRARWNHLLLDERVENKVDLVRGVLGNPALVARGRRRGVQSVCPVGRAASGRGSAVGRGGASDGERGCHFTLRDFDAAEARFHEAFAYG